MKRWTGSLALALLCAIIPAQAMDSQTVFNKVESNLDKGGTFYQITNSGPVWKNLPVFMKAEIVAYSEALSSGRQSDPGPKILSMLDTVEAKVLPVLKFDKILGWGISQSVNGALPDGTELYLSKEFALVDQADGGIPALNIIKGESFSINELNKFPETTLVAVVATVNATEFAKLVLPMVQAMNDDPAFDFSAKMAEPIPELDNMSVNQLLEHISGKIEYSLAMVPSQVPGGKSSLAYTLSVPDPDAKLFVLIKNTITKQMEKEPAMQKIYTVTDNSIGMTLPFPPGMMPIEIAPEIYSADGRLQFSSNQNFRKLVEGGSSLANAPEFQALTKGLPETGAILAYVKPNSSVVIAETMAELPGIDPDAEAIFAASADNPMGRLGAAEVINFTPEGILSVENITIDQGTLQFLGQATLGVYFIAKPYILKKLSEEASAKSPGQSDVAQCEEEMAASERNLEVFADYLAQYAAANENAYPASMDLLVEKFPAVNEEFSELGMPDDYAIGYFPGYTPKDGNKPLVYILPEDGSFLCVLFADGNVGSWTMRDMPVKSAKGVVSFLQTEEEYPEAVLNELVEKAEVIDAANAVEEDASESEMTVIYDENEEDAPAEADVPKEESTDKK